MKHKVFSLINVIGLTIGLSASFIIGLMIYYDFTFDNFHKDNDRIFRVVTNFSSPDGKSFNAGVSLALEDAIKDNTNFEVVNSIIIETPSIVENKEENIVKKWPKYVIYTTPEYFDIFEYNFLAGNKNEALKNPNQVILTDTRAKEYFPKLHPAEIIGKTLVYNDSLQIKVTGVIENLKGRTEFIFQELISYPTLLSTRLRRDILNKDWNMTNSANQLFVKVNANANFDQIKKEFNYLATTYLDEYSRKHNHSKEFALQPLNDIHLNTKYEIYDWEKSRTSMTLLKSLGLVVVVLLLLGCINFINLNTAQATQRSKEIGIRKALGSSREQLIIQFMGETFLLVLISGIFSLLLSKWLLLALSDFVQQGITISLFANPIMIISIILLLVLVTFLSGFYPALVLSKMNTISVLKNSVSTGDKKVFLRKFLTIFQFTIAQIFIIATLLVGKQINFLLSKDMGFKTEAIATIISPRDENELAKKELFIQKLKAIPQIKNACLGNTTPASNTSSLTTATHTNSKGVIAQSDLRIISGDVNYANLFDLKLLAGKIFKNDTIHELVINEAARKVFGFKTPEEAIGKTLDFGGDKVPIVGVMSDFIQGSLHYDIVPMALNGDWSRHYFRSRFSRTFIAFENLSPNDFRNTLDTVERIYGEVYTESQDYRIKFMDDTINEFYSKEYKISKLLKWATGLSILISCLGLWGLVIYTTNRRVKEIGMRKVLGASVLQINKLLCKEFLILVGIAFMLATPIAWYFIYKWLQDFSYRTDISFMTFLISGFIMIVFALIVISIKTIQAASSNPVNSLRSE